MLKNVKWFFVVLVFSSFISLSFDKRKTPTEKLPLGAQAPELVLGKEKQPLSLQAAKGNYILLSFWASYDPNTGCFNTEEQKITLFNKPSNMTYNDWLISDARYLLNRIQKEVVEWVYEKDMTDEEKASHPTYETTGGYLRVLDESECAQIWWDGLSETDKSTIKAIPNFDGEIFEECTGIKIREVSE